MAEPDVAMRTFDQSRNVRDRCPAVAIEVHHAHDRVQRRKWIGRHLRMGGGNFSEQGRLPRIWVTDESGVRHRAELEKEMSLLPFFAFRVLDRGAVLRAFKMDVALSPAAAFAEDELLVLIGQ